MLSAYTIYPSRYRLLPESAADGSKQDYQDEEDRDSPQELGARFQRVVHVQAAGSVPRHRQCHRDRHAAPDRI